MIADLVLKEQLPLMAKVYQIFGGRSDALQLKLEDVEKEYAAHYPSVPSVPSSI